MTDDTPSMSESIHPELRTIARFLPRRVSVGPRTLKLFRAVAAVTTLRRTPSDVAVLSLPSGVGVRVCRPATGFKQPAPALLWIHGGGYVSGYAKQDDALCRRFARTLGITVASVEYRLAPEHPYPAALDDCSSALTWLASLPTVDPAHIAVGGGSAGAGLAAALALRARDRDEIHPVLQLLAYPMLDDRTVTRPELDKPRYPVWNQASNRFGWTSYLGQADPQVAVPARHDDLSGLPPTWIGVGTVDLFHDEGLAYAERLTEAGVACHVEVVPGAFHIFDQIAQKTHVANAFFDSECASLRTAFGTAEESPGSPDQALTTAHGELKRRPVRRHCLTARWAPQ